MAGSISGRSGFWINGVFGLEGILGVGFMNSEIEFKTGTIGDSREETHWGLHAGVQATVRPLAWLDLYARYSGIGAVDFANDDAQLENYEVGAALTLSRKYGIAAMAGWRRWHVEDAEIADSAVEAELSGPFAGLRISF